MPARFISEIFMRRLLFVLCLLLTLPVMATGLLDSRPSATLGAINNSAEFLPVREAFKGRGWGLAGRSLMMNFKSTSLRL